MSRVKGRKNSSPESIELVWAYEKVREENKELRERIKELEKQLNESTKEVVQYKKKLIELHYYF
jgi:cell division septum initiation protein DivIVA